MIRVNKAVRLTVGAYTRLVSSDVCCQRVLVNQFTSSEGADMITHRLTRRLIVSLWSWKSWLSTVCRKQKCHQIGQMLKRKSFSLQSLELVIRLLEQLLYFLHSCTKISDITGFPRKRVWNLLHVWLQMWWIYSCWVSCEKNRLLVHTRCTKMVLLPPLSWFWLAGLCDQLHVNHEGYTVTGRTNSPDPPKGSFPWRFIEACFSSARLSFPRVVQPALALSPGSDRQANWWTPTRSLQSNLARRTNQPHWSHSTRVSPSCSQLPHSLVLIIFSYLSLSLKGIVRQKI